MRSVEGGGGVSQMLTFAYMGGRGEVWRGAKSAHAILELSLGSIQVSFKHVGGGGGGGL